jgi:hypothetical protein
MVHTSSIEVAKSRRRVNNTIVNLYRNSAILPGETRITPIARRCRMHRHLFVRFVLRSSSGERLRPRSAAGGRVCAGVFCRAGADQTVLVTAEEIAVVPDRSHEDPAKAQLVLYNVSTRARVALVTAEAGQAVIPALAPLTGSAIAVNAVAVRFAVTVGNDDSPHTVEVAPFSLRRGASFSIFAFEPGEGVVTVVDQASVEVE